MSEIDIHPLQQARRKLGIKQKVLADLTGLSEPTIKRAESGRPLDDYTITAICDFFSMRYERQVDAGELGLHAKWERKETLLGNGQHSDKPQNTDQTAEEIGAIQSSSFLRPSIQTIEDTDVLDRLLKAIKKPTSIDTIALTHLETTTKNNWNLYASFENSIQYRHDMLTGVSGHLQTITQLLEHPQPTQTQHNLAALACETAQLMGEIYFDLKDNEAALRYYNTAIALAGETDNHILLATALGRKSFIPIYNDDPQQALSLLQEANVRLTGDRSDIIRAWLAAREAEAHAKFENADACAEALDKAERYLERARLEEAPSLAFTGEARNVHFTHTMLLGYKGACYTRLKNPVIAQAALQEDLASINPARRIHHAIVLADLARTYIQQGEIPEACRLAKEGLLIVIQLKSARVLQRILDLRRDLEPWKHTEDVKSLDGQLLTLPHLT